MRPATQEVIDQLHSYIRSDLWMLKVMYVVLAALAFLAWRGGLADGWGFLVLANIAGIWIILTYLDVRVFTQLAQLHEIVLPDLESELKDHTSVGLNRLFDDLTATKSNVPDSH